MLTSSHVYSSPFISLSASLIYPVDQFQEKVEQAEKRFFSPLLILKGEEWSRAGVCVGTYLRSRRKLALEPGALTASPGPDPTTSPQGNPGQGGEGRGLPTAGGALQGWALAPAHHHQLLLCCLPAEALPHVNGKQGAAAVEDGGE